MVKLKKVKLVRLKDVQAKLVLPGRKDAISTAALYTSHLPALNITPVNSEGKEKTNKNQESFVTEEQAALIEARFKEKHWRKFKDAAG